MNFFVNKIKQYIQGYEIYKCWANFSVGDYIFWHQHPEPVVKSLVYYLVNKNNYGTMFRLNRETEEDPTETIKIIGGDTKKTIMVGDSETDSNASKAANIPFVLIEDGYTEKKKDEIYHDHLVKDFVGLEKIIEKYL